MRAMRDLSRLPPDRHLTFEVDIRSAALPGRQLPVVLTRWLPRVADSLRPREKFAMLMFFDPEGPCRCNPPRQGTSWVLQARPSAASGAPKRHPHARAAPRQNHRAPHGRNSEIPSESMNEARCVRWATTRISNNGAQSPEEVPAYRTRRLRHNFSRSGWPGLL